MQLFEIIEINKELLSIALSSEVDDFEDSVIEVSSKKINVDYVLTRNIKDFKKSIVNAITPEELLAIL